MPAPYPSPYVHGYSYTAFEAVAPGDPKPGGALDADFYGASAAINSLILALADVRRADGTISSYTVTPSSLAPATVALMGDWTMRGPWIVGRAYAIKDVVTAPVGGGTFICVTPHTSAVFNTELAAGKWACIAPTGYGVTAAIAPSGGGDAGKLLSATGADTYAWIAPATITPLAGFRNRLINPGFLVNARAFVSGASLAPYQFGLDRWRGGAGGCTMSFTLTTPAATVTITAGTLLQTVEGANSEGGTFALSWAGTAQARINGGSWGTSPLTAAGLTAGTNIAVEFGTGTVSRPQLEPNGVTAYEIRPPAVEQIMCERYCRLATGHIAGYVNGVSRLGTTLMWPHMRAIPSAVLSGGTATNVTSTALDQLTPYSGRFSAIPAGAGHTEVANVAILLDAEV